MALGTAQLGGPYGIANRLGQPSEQETRAILDLAVGAGIRWLDTASAYGDAEVRIGRFVRERSLRRTVRVVTKLTVRDVAEEISLRAAIARSGERLGTAPAGVLLHDPDLLAAWRGPLGDVLRSARSEGAVGAIGVSVYHPEQFAAALAIPELDIVQAPFNVLDRRLEQSGLLEQSRERGIHVMLRSVFLQGLLLVDPARWPPGLAFARPRLRRWHELCVRHRVAPIVAALRFVTQRTQSATVVVGCESQPQLRELLAAANGPDLPAAMLVELESLASSDRRLLDPTRWPR